MAQVAALVDLLLIPLGRHLDPPRHFSAAAHHDLPELGTFISARQASRRFAEPVTIESLARELARLPERRVDQTFMVRDGTGTLTACRCRSSRPSSWSRSSSSWRVGERARRWRATSSAASSVPISSGASSSISASTPTAAGSAFRPSNG